MTYSFNLMNWVYRK